MNQGSNKIRGIMLHPPQSKTVELHPKAFKRMKNLKFLVVANVHVRRGFTYLPRQLRLLDWPDYPFSLPSNFFPEHLVTLNMPHSHVGLKSLFSQVWFFELMNYDSFTFCWRKFLIFYFLLIGNRIWIFATYQSQMLWIHYGITRVANSKLKGIRPFWVYKFS